MNGAVRANPVEGSVDPAFEQVRDVFRANFDDSAPYPEIGAAYCVYADGHCVLDLWGGMADPNSGRAWSRDTLVHVFSTTKGWLAIAIAQLVDRGLLAYDDPVAKHWPEFAVNGKAQITVAHLLSHTAGLNGFDEKLTIEDMGDWERIVGLLASQAPAWEPGTITSYHSTTFGFLLGEVARRITGLMPRELIAKYLAEPLGLDLSIGVAESDWDRVAVLTPPPPGERPQRDPLAMRAMGNPALTPADTALPAWRNAQVPAVNGHASARGLARLWGSVANGGQIDGVTILSPGAIEGMRVPMSQGPDLFMGPGAWGAGVLINRNGVFGPNADAFGSCGFGGSSSYADPELGIGAAYTPNRLFGSVLQDPRSMALAQAVAEAAGRAGS